MSYPDHLTILEAREIYFSESGFDAQTYTDRWVELPVFGFKISLPNFKARREAAPLHDINHILTGYKTDWRGEWEISAFELGSGTGKYWAAWGIGLQAIIAGAFRTPQKCLRAFARGRRSQSVYKMGPLDTLLKLNVKELRDQTTMPEGAFQPDLTDRLSFALHTLLAITLHAAPAVLALIIWQQLK